VEGSAAGKAGFFRARWGRQGDNAEDARTDAFGNRFDGAAFTRAITASKTMQTLSPLLTTQR
jgi:hypothetical protein